MDAKTCLTTRRSVRRFTDEPVSRELLREVVSLAQFAPTWKNSQTARYTIVEDPQLKNIIAEQAVLGFQKNTDNLKSAAAAVIVTTVDGISGYNEDGTPTTALGSHWQSFDAGLSVQTFCLAAHDLGLATVIMGIFDRKGLQEHLQLPEGQELMALIALGHPAEVGPAPKRKDVETLLSYR